MPAGPPQGGGGGYQQYGAPPPNPSYAGGHRGQGRMHAGAQAFVPLEGAMSRMHVGGPPPMPSGGPGAWGGHGGPSGSYAQAAHHHQQQQAGYHPQQAQYYHPHLMQQQQPQEEEQWGYEDEEGNWVSFNDGNEEVEFLKSQLPSEDDFLDGLGADTGPSNDQGGNDEWGYYDDKGACTLTLLAQRKKREGWLEVLHCFCLHDDV